MSGPLGEGGAGTPGVRMIGAVDPLADWDKRGELSAGRRRITGLPGAAGELVPGEQGLRMIAAKDLLADWQ